MWGSKLLVAVQMLESAAFLLMWWPTLFPAANSSKARISVPWKRVNWLLSSLMILGPAYAFVVVTSWLFARWGNVYVPSVPRNAACVPSLLPAIQISDQQSVGG